MKTIKRTVAALLATLMLATSTSFTLAAETYTDDESVVVAKVSGAGIMTGTDKGFEPSKSLTRAEAAAIIVRMKGIKESAVKAMAGTTLFTDVAASHWASGYVNEASNLGIVKGVSATEFAPEREVTVAEFVTMAVRALGAGQLVDSEGTWPTNYVNFANENDILEDVTAIYTAVASRMNAATIVANTLEAPIWEKTGVKSNGEIEWTKSVDVRNTNGTITPAKTILNTVLKIVEYKDVRITDSDVKERTMSINNDADDDDDYDDTLLTDEDVAEAVDMVAAKKGVAYDLWYNTDKKVIVAIFKADNSKQKTYEFTELKSLTNKIVKVVIDGTEKEFDITTNTEYSINGSDLDTDALVIWDKQTGTKSAADILDKESTFGSIVVEGDDVVAIFAEEYKYAGVVEEVTSTRIKFESLHVSAGLADAEAIKLNDEDLIFFVEKNGKEAKISDVKEEDVVFYYTDGDEYHISILTDSAEGEITSKATSNKTIKLDGTKYDVSSLLTISADVEDEIIVYFNAAGKIVMYDEIEANGSYAVIKSIEAVSGRKGVDFEVVLAYADGTLSDTLTVDLDETAEELLDSDDEDDAREYLEQAASASTTASAANANIKNSSLAGHVVEYATSSGKLVIKADNTNKDTNNDIEYLDGAKLTVGRSKSFIEAVADTTKVDGAATAVTATETYWIKSNTKFLTIKNYTNASGAVKDEYKVKVESVELDSLDTSTGIDCYLVDIDEDNNVALVVIADDANLKREKVSEDWYFVLSTDTTREDYDLEVYLTDVNGNVNEKPYYTDESITAGKFGLIKLNGDVIVEELDTDGKYALANATDFSDVYFKEIKDGVLKLSDVTYTSTQGAEVYAEADSTFSGKVMAEDVLFVKYKDGEYTVSKESALEELTDLFETHEKVDQDEKYVDEATEILNLIIYTEDGVSEVVGVIFK